MPVSASASYLAIWLQTDIAAVQIQIIFYCRHSAVRQLVSRPKALADIGAIDIFDGTFGKAKYLKTGRDE